MLSLSGRLAALALLALFLQVRPTLALRTGAPSLACLNLRPFHGLHRAKPASASQFFLTQSALTYAPGQNITVELATHSSERYFRGFMVQAYDPSTGSQLGHFLASADSRSLSCSAATHKNNLNRRQVLITWLPPAPSNAADSPESQWLGVRVPHTPFINMSVGNRRRQLDQSVGGAGEPARVEQPAVPGGQVAPAPPSAEPVRQVRFRATVVVTYEEFYTGFESSEQSFAKFDYASQPAAS